MISVKSAFKWSNNLNLKPTKKNIRDKYVEGSEIMLDPQFDGGGLKSLVIELHGLSAHVPSIKNRKLAMNCPNPNTMGRIEALDILFRRAQQKLCIPITFGSSLVAGSLVTTSKGRPSDEDNVLGTIRDWLEPHDKKVGVGNTKIRGWGVGIVENDSQLTLFPVKAKSLDLTLPYTRIRLFRLCDVHQRLKEFFEEI